MLRPILALLLLTTVLSAQDSNAPKPLHLDADEPGEPLLVYIQHNPACFGKSADGEINANAGETTGPDGTKLVSGICEIRYSKKEHATAFGIPLIRRHAEFEANRIQTFGYTFRRASYEQIRAMMFREFGQPTNVSVSPQSECETLNWDNDVSLALLQQCSGPEADQVEVGFISMQLIDKLMKKAEHPEQPEP